MSPISQKLYIHPDRTVMVKNNPVPCDFCHYSLLTSSPRKLPFCAPHPKSSFFYGISLIMKTIGQFIITVA